jgi:indoleamine 2,3-dioxygenase
MLNIPSPRLPLENFRVSYETGFLPVDLNKQRKLPLKRLSDPYYSPWDTIVSDLPRLIKTGKIRAEVLGLPVLCVKNLKDEAEWQRAYLVLAFLTHAYVWGGEKAEEVNFSPLFQIG